MDNAPPPAPVAKPTPQPAKPQPTVVEKARADISKGKAGFHIEKPFRYVGAFINGTVTDGLNGLAKWAVFGLKWGAVSGFVASLAGAAGMLPVMGGMAGSLLAIAGSSTIFPPIIAFAAVAFVAGAALGAAHGLLTGGMRAMNREVRRDKYAEDLVQREQIRGRAPANRADYRTAWRASQFRDDLLSNQALLREQERDHDLNTYWQDREHRPSTSSNSR